jgi:MYXO-CTERM domain-containing protein
LFWGGACVGYSVNSASGAAISSSAAMEVIDAAFATWNGVACPSGENVGIRASDIGAVECGEVRYNQNGPNQNLIVFREDSWPYSDPNNTLGLTTVTFNADTGEIYDADMELNATGHNLSTGATVPANGFDLLSVVTHEAGHFLGLAHATNPSATMFASYQPGTSALRSLTPDDVAGVCEIYPNTKERRVAASVSATGVIAAAACDPTPRHGFGTTCAENPAPSQTDSGGCSVVSGPSSSSTGSLLLVVGLAGAVGAIRRRRMR